MPLKSIYFLPHGGVIIPGMEPDRDNDADTKQAADTLLKEMKRVGQEIKNDEIDIIFLTSPHGYLHPNKALIAFNSMFEGWQMYKKEGRMEQLMFHGHSQLAQIMYELCLQKEIPVEPLIFADPSYPLKIAWGETIPLQFLSDMENGPQIVLFSLPMTTEDGGIEAIGKIGDVIYELTDAPLMDDFNVSVVVSGDLSHKHDPDHDYGFHENASIFDKKSVDWFNDPTRDGYLELLDLHNTAESCGIFGMGLILRLLERLDWENQGITYELPTYFGMAISSWKSDSQN